MYEYKRVKAAFRNAEEIENYLNELGNNKWELVSIIESFAHNLFTIHCYFRKHKE